MLPSSETDDDLPISGLQHLAFCARQWGLIHLEQAWAENRLTAEGRLMHERVDLPGESHRSDVRCVRGLLLRSGRLRLRGRADVVEFRPGPFPIEYKRGRQKPSDCDTVQLCAQAICLEEMFMREVTEGAIFYGQPRRRFEVRFTADLRLRTEKLAETMHGLYAAGRTPVAEPGPHCRNCSLLEICLPEATVRTDVRRRWETAQLRSLQSGAD